MIEPGLSEVLDATEDPKFLEDAADKSGMQALVETFIENSPGSL